MTEQNLTPEQQTNIEELKGALDIFLQEVNKAASLAEQVGKLAEGDAEELQDLFTKSRRGNTRAFEKLKKFFSDREIGTEDLEESFAMLREQLEKSRQAAQPAEETTEQPTEETPEEATEAEPAEAPQRTGIKSVLISEGPLEIVNWLWGVLVMALLFLAVVSVLWLRQSRQIVDSVTEPPVVTEPSGQQQDPITGIPLEPTEEPSLLERVPIIGDRLADDSTPEPEARPETPSRTQSIDPGTAPWIGQQQWLILSLFPLLLLLIAIDFVQMVNSARTKGFLAGMQIVASPMAALLGGLVFLGTDLRIIQGFFPEELLTVIDYVALLLTALLWSLSIASKGDTSYVGEVMLIVGIFYAIVSDKSRGALDALVTNVNTGVYNFSGTLALVSDRQLDVAMLSIAVYSIIAIGSTLIAVDLHNNEATSSIFGSVLGAVFLLMAGNVLPWYLSVIGFLVILVVVVARNEREFDEMVALTVGLYVLLRLGFSIPLGF